MTSTQTELVANLPRKVYLAGPDVFYPNANEVFAELEAICASHDLVGLRPSDGGLSKGFTGTPDEIAERIYVANMALIAEADFVLANLRSFRGQEPDGGTVFEVGVAVALKKAVAVYGVPPGNYGERVCASLGYHRDARGLAFDSVTGCLIEEFDQRLNLMMSRSTVISDSAEEAIAGLAALARN